MTIVQLLMGIIIIIDVCDKGPKYAILSFKLEKFIQSNPCKYDHNNSQKF